MQRDLRFLPPFSLPAGFNLAQYVLDCLAAYNPFAHPCTRCNKNDWCEGKTSVYSRWLIWPDSGKPREGKVKIPTYLCRGCGKSLRPGGNKDGDYHHSIQIGGMIPFTPYSLPFVMEVLGSYFHRTCTVRQLCRQWEISTSTLYRWIKRYKDHYDAWADSLHRYRKFLEDMDAPDRRSALSMTLDWLRSQYPAPVTGFYEKIGYSFMQPNNMTHFRPPA